MLIPRIYVRRTESDFIDLFNQVALMRPQREALYIRLGSLASQTAPGSGSEEQCSATLKILLDNIRDAALCRYDLSQRQAHIATLMIAQPASYRIVNRADDGSLNEVPAEDVIASAMSSSEATLINAAKNSIKSEDIMHTVLLNAGYCLTEVPKDIAVRIKEAHVRGGNLKKFIMNLPTLGMDDGPEKTELFAQQLTARFGNLAVANGEVVEEILWATVNADLACGRQHSAMMGALIDYIVLQPQAPIEVVRQNPRFIGALMRNL